MAPIHVGINGYGVIGKRVADAVKLQPDMELAGIADVVSDYRVETATVLGIPVFVSDPAKEPEFREAGISLAGNLDDLVAQSDVIVDCTPKRIAAGNRERYRAAGKKAVFQGGESHEAIGHSFVAQANYAEALDRDATRVVSCNTTSVIRTLGALRSAGLLGRARGTLIRRATDIWEAHESGIMDTVVPEPDIPSHQGPDAQTVLPDLDLITVAAKASHTFGHIHYWFVDLVRDASRDEVLDAFRRAPRIAFVRSRDGVVAINSTRELMRDLGRPRGDMWEVALWEDILQLDGRELTYVYQVDNEAIVIPETIDAIRALTGSVRDAAESIRTTDESLGMRQEFLHPLPDSRVAAAAAAP